MLIRSLLLSPELPETHYLLVSLFYFYNWKLLSGEGVNSLVFNITH